ncbi:hypothetical protein MLD38_023181 [Melastoma candidum]|uniref:Uncharacterized protein n=1 Tax=Melastoma candidum TaxID=119954 RepID=A0ACB9QKU1_9MYRT|nr:hypothetical protein MLD38_023181 [Melastoma candidum]
MEANAENNDGAARPVLSKTAQKKLMKQQKYLAKKAEKKVQEKERKKLEAARKKKEWEEKLEGIPEKERVEMIEKRKETRKERMVKRLEKKGMKMERLKRGRESGVNLVVDLEFSYLMSGNEINSLCQQIMYCYAVNGRCKSPCHLWLTGCRGEMESQLLRLPGFDKWIVERESRSYIEAFQDQKDNLVYLTADSENVLEVLNPEKYYIVGGIVDRNRWKGITMKKAEEQGIQTAKLPIGTYLKTCSSQVLTVNQVIEILLKFVETGDWKASFFQVIPQRKRCGDNAAEVNGSEAEHDENPKKDAQYESKKQRCSDDSIEGKGEADGDENSEEEDGQSKSRKMGVDGEADSD